jgi:hypothetical protein
MKPTEWNMNEQEKNNGTSTLYIPCSITNWIKTIVNKVCTFFYNININFVINVIN